MFANKSYKIDSRYHRFYIKLVSRANQQRSQKIFKAQQPMDLTQVRTKLQGFGMQLLDGIDPNPDNFVCAGIVHMRAQQVGCLLRLEPNKQAQVSSLIFEYSSYVTSGVFSFNYEIFIIDVSLNGAFK